MMSKAPRKAAIVTGSARGIGAAAAQALAACGIDIVLGVRDAATAGDAALAVERAGSGAAVVACDVAKDGAAEKLVEVAMRRFGRIDILINNAGVIEPIAVAADSSPSAWSRNIEINLVGAYRCIHAVLPHLLRQGEGVIVKLSSGAAHRPLEGWSAYCAAKAGLAMLTRSIALEYGSRGVRVFGFAPGTTDTDMQAVIRASGVNAISKLKRTDLVPAHEPAAAIAYLCSQEAEDLAGAELTLNDAALRQRVGIRLLEPIVQ